MQKQTLTLLVGALVLVAGGSLVVPRMLADDMPIVKWTARDEVEVPREPAELATTGDENATVERSEAALPETGGANDERVDVLVRGRVIDKFKAPVPTAKGTSSASVNAARPSRPVISVAGVSPYSNAAV